MYKYVSNIGRICTGLLNAIIPCYCLPARLEHICPNGWFQRTHARKHLSLYYNSCVILGLLRSFHDIIVPKLVNLIISTVLSHFQFGQIQMKLSRSERYIEKEASKGRMRNEER